MDFWVVNNGYALNMFEADGFQVGIYPTDDLSKPLPEAIAMFDISSDFLTAILDYYKEFKKIWA